MGCKSPCDGKTAAAEPGRGKQDPPWGDLLSEVWHGSGGCWMSYVFVVDARHSPRRPGAPAAMVHPGPARFLLRGRHAAIPRHSPFTLVLAPASQPPGSP